MSRVVLGKMAVMRMTRTIRVVAVVTMVFAFGTAFSTVSAQQTAARDDAADVRDANAEAVLDRKVTVSLTDVSLERAVDAIAKLAHANVLSDWTMLRRYAKSVTLKADQETLRSVFNRLFAGTSLQVVARPHAQLVIADGVAAANAGLRDSTETVTGTIVDSTTGKSIERATVTVEGTKNAAVTNARGIFTLRNVSVGQTRLVIRAFGYRPLLQPITVLEEVPLSLRVRLANTVNVLSGVVTTVSGVQSRREVGNDITVLDVDSIRRVAPIATVTDLLETRVPGLIVQRTSGIPGAPSRLRLRGTSSPERSNDPIIIVDGIRVYSNQSSTENQLTGNFLGNSSGPAGTMAGHNTRGIVGAPSPLDQIDLNSIETVEVMKGSSASAMYGSDAGNGVIVITTKRGRPGTTRWNAALGTGISKLPAGGYPINYFQLGHQFNGPTRLCTPYEGCLQDRLIAYQALNTPEWSPFGTGTRHDASLTVSGGSGTMTYSITGSGSTDLGILKIPSAVAQLFEKTHGFIAPGWMRRPNRYTTWSGNAAITMPLGAQGDLVLTNSLQRSSQQQASLQSVIETLQGVFVDTTDTYEAAYNGSSALIFSRYSHHIQNKALTNTTGATLRYPLLELLPLQVTGGLSFANRDATDLLPRGYVVRAPNCPVGQPTCAPFDSVGWYAVARGSNIGQTFNISVTPHLPARGRLPAMRFPVGFNLDRESATSLQAETDTLIGVPPGVTEPSGLVGGAIQATRAVTTYGWFVAPTLELTSRLFVSPGFRLDGGSASGTGATFSPFPKLDFSWIAIDQPERPVFGAITGLRPRIAFGIAGIQPRAEDQLRTYQSNFVTLPGGGAVTSQNLVGFGNTQLHPERQRELEGGIDLDLWNQRLSMIVTGYSKMRYDAILETAVPLSVAGGGTIRQNVGTIRNSGIDASVSAQIFDARAVGWQVTTLVHKNRNMVQSLSPGFNSNCSGNNADGCIIAGYPLFGRWARPILSYSDANRNSMIEPNEVRIADTAVYVGAQEPNYELTVSTNLQFWNGRIRLNTAVDYQNGMTQVNQGGGFGTAFDPSLSIVQQVALAAAVSTSTRESTNYGLIQTVNTLRWQSFSLNYQMPPSVTRLFRAGSMSLALQGRNLGLHTNYRGKDPNVNALSTGNRVTDMGQLPQAREWSLRVALGQ